MKRALLLLTLAAFSPAFAQPQSEKPVSKEPADGPWSKKALAGKDLWATFKTSQGDILVKLYAKQAPKTVANFVGLATGEKEWRHPQTGEVSKKPLYDGVVFHRVIPEFMIQGGDP